MTLLAIPLGLAIGLIVGTVGGGGAILALPVLVYVLGEGVSQASTASLIVVALAAGVGGGTHALRGLVCWRIALGFSVPAAGGAVAGTALGATVDPRTLILAFVPVMLVAAFATWARAPASEDDAAGRCPPTPAQRLVLAGLAVGVLTGFFGVGGGFLIVPALALALRVPVRRAIATSLVIVTLTAVAALASHLAAGVDLDVPVTAALAVATGVGAVAGTTFGARLPQQVLARAFSVVVAALAVFLLADVLLLGGPPTS